jgi:hypothetical protein
MSNSQTLSYWVATYLEGEKSESTAQINLHFAMQEIFIDSWTIIAQPNGPMETQVNAF